MSDRNRGDRAEGHGEGRPGGYQFYSSREERLAGREEPVRETGSVFRRNRSLLIIMLDIVIVLLMFLLYLLFVQPEPAVQVGPYTIEGAGFLFDDDLYLTATVAVEPEHEVVSGGESLVEVEFPDGVVVTDVLPSSPDHATIVRHVLPASDVAAESGDDVVITVRLLDQSVEVPVTVSR